MLSAFVSLLGGLASEPGHEGTADREHLVARLCGLWATYSRIGGGPAPRAVAEGPAAAGPCSDGGQGRAPWASGCKTSIAQPTFSPSPSQLGHPVRAVTRRPCVSVDSLSALIGSAGTGA